MMPRSQPNFSFDNCKWGSYSGVKVPACSICPLFSHDACELAREMLKVVTDAVASKDETKEDALKTVMQELSNQAFEMAFNLDLTEEEWTYGVRVTLVGLYVCMDMENFKNISSRFEDVLGAFWVQTFVMDPSVIRNLPFPKNN